MCGLGKQLNCTDPGNTLVFAQDNKGGPRAACARSPAMPGSGHPEPLATATAAPSQGAAGCVSGWLPRTSVLSRSVSCALPQTMQPGLGPSGTSVMMRRLLEGFSYTKVFRHRGTRPARAGSSRNRTMTWACRARRPTGWGPTVMTRQGPQWPQPNDTERCSVSPQKGLNPRLAIVPAV
jgi:hypothetical protein